ncbi:MAG: cytochrome P460 family protein [Thermodesulfovibrionales bacterium]|nr:cytochrome P460 family protein [Thermodesulfovibrionales bacterium]
MKKIAIFLLILLVLSLSVSFAKMNKGISLPKEWRNFIHVKSMVIPDKNHGLYGFHHIYVNKKGLETLKKGGMYPEGTIFIGVFYDVVTERDGSINQGKKLFYVYMKKDKRATETGGWRYAAFDPDGKYLEKDVKKECYDCHTAAKDSDYIFSKFIE